MNDCCKIGSNSKALGQYRPGSDADLLPGTHDIADIIKTYTLLRLCIIHGYYTL